MYIYIHLHTDILTHVYIYIYIYIYIYKHLMSPFKVYGVLISKLYRVDILA